MNSKAVLVNVTEFENYNNLRYGRPWLAKLKGIPGSVKLNYQFIDEAFVPNNDEPGSGGVLMGYLSDGDYVAYGQKDFRGNNSVSWHGIFLDGKLQKVSKPEIVNALSQEKQ